MATSVVQRPVYTESDLIPKERYISKEWLDLEYERLWPRVWQMACRLEEIPNVGDYVEYSIGDQSVLVVRESSGTIRAYRNSCLHRGTRLKSVGSCGNTEDKIRCRFHGWAWNLDGSIRQVMDREDFAPECVARETLQLREVHVGTWGGFVFINFAADPEPLLEYLSPIPEALAPFEPEKMRIRSHRTTVIDCNWKTGLDAFNESYHVDASHKLDLSGRGGSIGRTGAQTLRARADARVREDDRSGSTAGRYRFDYQVFERHNMLRMTADQWPYDAELGTLRDFGSDPRAALVAQMESSAAAGLTHQENIDYVRNLKELPSLDTPVGLFLNRVTREVGRAGGIDYSHIPDEDLNCALDYCFFPNALGPLFTGNWVIFRFRPNGDDPESCIFDVYFLHRYPEGAEPPAVEHKVFAHWTDPDPTEWDSVLLQDMSNMAHVQRGMHESSFPGLRLGWQERGIRNHHKVLARYILEDEA